MKKSDHRNHDISDPNQPTLTCVPDITSIQVIVTKPNSGGVEKYEATCSSCDTSSTESKNDDNGATFTYENLASYNKYIVEVQSVFGNKRSGTAQTECRTEQAGKFDYF